MDWGADGRVEDEAVAIGAALVTAVGGLDEQRHGAVLQLITDLCNGLAIASTTVIHTLT